MRIENDYEMKLLIFVDSFKQMMEDFETSDIILNVQGQTFIRLSQNGQGYAWSLPEPHDFQPPLMMTWS